MPEPLRILYTIPNFITAGSGQALANIILRLDRSRFKPSVCVSRRGGKLESVLEAAGVPILEHDTAIPPKPYFSLAKRANETARFFKPHGFEIWHSFHYSDDYTEALVARFSGAHAWVFTKKNMSWNGRSWLLRALLAGRILAQNTDMLQSFFARWPLRGKTRLVQRGVDLERFQPLSAAGVVRTQFGIPENAPLAGVVAQLVSVKGHAVVIQAAAQIPGLHLALAGGPLQGEYYDSLQTLARSCNITDRVHFLGAVSDVPAFLSEMDIFVLPTFGRMRMEGCPVALLEAMACAKACIATDIPGSRDLIISGECGLLVPPEDPAALANAIQVLIDSPDLRQKFGQAARRRVEKHFSIEREVQDHEALYEAIIKDRRSRP